MKIYEDYNRVEINGMIMRKEIKATEKTQIATFTVLNKGKRWENGQYVENPNWINCVMMGKDLTWFDNRFNDKDLVTVRGEFLLETYNGKTNMKVNVRSIDKRASYKDNQDATQTTEYKGSQDAPQATGYGYDDDLPF